MSEGDAGWWAEIRQVKIRLARYATRQVGTKSMSTGTIKIGPDGIGWHGVYGFPSVHIAWPALKDILIQGESVQTGSVAAVATFGVLGLGAKKRKTMTRLDFVTTTGEHVFEIDRTDPSAVRNQLRQLIDAMPKTTPASAPAPAAISVADELSKLAALRDQGLLSPEEFEAQKQRLLAR